MFALNPICNAHVAAFNNVGGLDVFLGASSVVFGLILLLNATNPLVIAVPTSPAANPTTANCAPLKTNVPRRCASVKCAPDSNILVLGHLQKMEGSILADADADVGAKRYISTKLTIAPTTRVEKTKSSSLRPKLGRQAMSPATFELTPTTSSISTLNGNCGSAATLDLQPFRNMPMITPKILPPA
ncbi:hypothetical protein GIB67_006766 [Kingdonia uniflora]|uniref:Uncharacterized protein n=1 Tax=Kingdonia uniflora TaxID=39325 RepID=A0A7J7LYV4_9MAGN|nr:hypothetical protein GIB67_006766 [Kingdonia uniflora]